MLTISLINAGLILILFTALWAVSLWLRDVSIVDPFWGLGFVVLAWSTHIQKRYVTGTSPDLGDGLLLLLTTVWGLRLAIYLFWRKWHEPQEDRRYAAMRVHHGPRFWWVSGVTVFGLQAVLLWLIGWPQQAGQISATWDAWWAMGWLGGVLAGFGVGYEALADWQLAQFKRRPENKGRVLRRGLWRYSRHPNYFGDCCFWWGIYLVACYGGAWWTVFAPLLMTIFLLKVSGVTLLERDIQERRPEYREYLQQTNAFIPGPPRAPI